jgi:hypothetical protein
MWRWHSRGGGCSFDAAAGPRLDGAESFQMSQVSNERSDWPIAAKSKSKSKSGSGSVATRFDFDSDFDSQISQV